MKVKHVVLTRFNLATPGREETIRNQPGWLAERFELFERYCLPTVAAQNEKDFEWIIFFDEETPAEFKARIEELREIQDFYPYYTGLFAADGWASAIREVVGPQPEGTFLLSTRLDNDDGLARDYTARLRREAEISKDQQGSVAFNFTQGFVLYHGKVYLHRHKSNAFAGLLEPFGTSMRTINTIPHMDLANQVELRQISGSGAWLQVIHETNVSNKIRGQRISSAKIEDLFPPSVSEEFRNASAVEAFLENASIGLVRSARDRILDLRRILKGTKPV